MESEEGLTINSNFSCRPIASVFELDITNDLKEKIEEIIPNISPAFQYGLSPMVQGESIYLSSPSGTQRSTLSIIGILHILDPALKANQALVVAPRKDLIDEYLETFAKYNKGINLSILKCVGGEFVNKKVVKKSQVLVCTPGKLCALIDSGTIELTGLKIVVFDVCNGLFFKEMKIQTEKALGFLNEDLIYWFLTPVFDEISKDQFLLKKSDGKTLEIVDERVLKQIKYFYKVYEYEEDIFKFLNAKCEENDKKIVIFTCDVVEIEKTCIALERFQPLRINESMALDQQLSVRDEFYHGNHQVIVVHGVFHCVRKIISKSNVQVFCLDLVNSAMLLARARRGTFKKGDEVILFCKEYESENVSKLALELRIDIFSIS
jgi:ATP-dependent RNA helicase DeaD